MNINLVLSFFIAGILLMSILSMNNNLSQSSTQLAMQQIVQQRINTVGELLQNDIPKIGYNSTGVISEPIEIAESKKIQFKSNIDNDPDGNIETITWEFTADKVTNSQNPDVYILERTAGADFTQIKSGVTEFKIIYLDKDRNELTSPNANLDKIQHINISVTIESPETVDQGGERYLKTNWSRTFTPINLTL